MTKQRRTENVAITFRWDSKLHPSSYLVLCGLGMRLHGLGMRLQVPAYFVGGVQQLRSDNSLASKSAEVVGTYIFQ